VPELDRHIVLIGLRGSGKSTVGRIVADRLRIPFVDLDDRTPRLLAEPTAADALRNHGEAAFRAAEAEALREALNTRAFVVIALGGGTPTAPGAPDMLRGSGCALIYLRGEPGALRQRLQSTDLGTRPSLTGDDPLVEIDRVFEQRDPLYRALAHSVIAVDDRSVPEIAGEIERALLEI